MPDTMKTYDPALVIGTWGGIPVVGVADGTFFKVVRDEDTFSKKTGAAGEVTRVRNRNRGGSIEITVLQSSSFNDVLAAGHAIDEASGLGVKPFFLKDLSGTTLVQANNSWVKKPADGEFAKDATNRTWILDVDDLQIFTGGLVVP